MNARISSLPFLYTPGSIIDPSWVNRSAKASASCAAQAATIRAGTAAMAACSACSASALGAAGLALAFGAADLLAVICVSRFLYVQLGKRRHTNLPGRRNGYRLLITTVASGQSGAHLRNC